MNSEARVSILMEAQDKVTQTVKSVQGSLSGLQSSVEKMQPAFKTMAVAGGVAFGAISTLAVTSVNAFADAQKTMTIASKALENSLTEMSAGSLTTLQNQLGKGTNIMDGLKSKMDEVGKSAVQLGFDDESASLAFAKFFQISKDVSQAQRDVKLAMDLSAFSGRDLESAQKAITMAYAGGTRVLKEFGIEVKDGATATEVFEAIQKKTAGTAEELAKSTSGQMAILNTQLGNLQESIGGALAPALSKVMEIIQPLVTKFVEWAEQNPDLIAKIILVTGAIAGLLLVVGTIGIIVPTLITGFSLLTSAAGGLAVAIGAISLPVLAIIAVIGALIAAGIYLYMHWDTVKAYAQETWTSITTYINTAINKIQSYVTGLWEWLKSSFNALVTPLTNAWNALWNSLAGVVLSAWNNVKSIIQDTVNWVINKVNAVINAINSIASAGGNAIGIRAPQLPNIPLLGDGGIVTSPTLAMIGERNEPEAVIPLSKLGNFGGGQSIIVNITGGTFLDKQAGQILGDQIVDALRLQMRI